MKSGPGFDPPFEPDVIAYIGRFLEKLSVSPSRAWLSVPNANLENLWVGNFSQAVSPARAAIPKNNEVWEASDFFRCAILISIDLICQGPVTRYSEFELAMLEVLGEEARFWLPSLFLAAAASPCIEPERRRMLVDNFDSDRLFVEQEALDRQLRASEE